MLEQMVRDHEEELAKTREENELEKVRGITLDILKKGNRIDDSLYKVFIYCILLITLLVCFSFLRPELRYILFYGIQVISHDSFYFAHFHYKHGKGV